MPIAPTAASNSRWGTAVAVGWATALFACSGSDVGTTSAAEPVECRFGTDDGGLWHTTDGGHTWTDLWTLNEGLETEVEAETLIGPVTEAIDEAVEALIAMRAAEGPCAEIPNAT